MRNPLGCWRWLAVLVTAAVAVAEATTARADLIFFKDGFVIEGRMVREGERHIENNEMLFIPKGFFYVDDGVRRTYVCPMQIQEPTKKEFTFGDELSQRRTSYPSSVKGMPPIAEVLEATPWNDKWQRTIMLRTAP